MRKTISPVIGILGFILILALTSHAKAEIAGRLGGDYFVIGSRSCVYASNSLPFNADLSLPGSGGTTRTGHYQGHMNLNANGTGTFEYYLTQYYQQFVGPFQTPISAASGSCNVAAEELPSGRLRMTLSSCIADIVDGLGEGTTWENDDETLTFDMSMNGELLLFSNTRPVIERTWNVLSPTLVTERLCSRTITAVRRFPQR